MTPLLAAVLAYLALQFGIGVWASRRIRTEADYLVAGRRLGYPLAICSIFATWFGAETVVGAAGRTVREGVSLTSAEPFGYALCLILMGLVFARPLWRRQLTTLADLFRQRYSLAVERLAAVILIPASLLWAAAQMRAFGHVLSITATLDVGVAVAVAAALCVLYTAFGGLLADAVTDVVQGALLVIGLLVLGAVVVLQLGGLEGTAMALRQSDRFLGPGAPDGSVLAALEAWAIPVGGSVIATELVARVIATRTAEIARRSALAAGAIYLAVGAIPVLIGGTAAGLGPVAGDPDQFLAAVAHRLLPVAAYAIFAGAVISAILSTVDSTLLAASGLLSHNILMPLLGVREERSLVRLARAGVVAFGFVAYFLARHADGVYTLVEQASAFGGAGVLVTVCFGLFTTWGGPRTALATLVAGAAVYAAGSLGGLPYPFLASLATSLGVYAGGAAAERALARSRHRAIGASQG